MNKKFDISVVIPFYKRDKYAVETFKSLSEQSLKASLMTEVIFVDSKSRTYLEQYLINNKNTEFKIFDVDDYVSTKRNLGIRKARSNNIIVIDDDCKPEENFLSNHYNKLQENKGKKELYCGVITYDNSLIKKSNYFKFRDTLHRFYDKTYQANGNLNFHNIVVMNMSFNKDVIENSKIFFNEEHNTYGFEDLQFGIDALTGGIAIKTCNAKVIHQDSTPLSIYYKKLISFGKTYFALFYKINIKYFKIAYNEKSHNKNNIIIKHIKEYKRLFWISRINSLINRKYFVVKILFFALFCLIRVFNHMLMFYLKVTDKSNLLYSFKLYKLFVYMIILESFFGKQEINKGWL